MDQNQIQNQDQNINNFNGGISGPNAFAIASFVCGIAAATNWGSFVSLVLGIVGLVLAAKAKKGGVQNGLRKAGFIMSLIAVIFAVISLIVAAVAVAGVISFVNFIGGSISDIMNMIPQ